MITPATTMGARTSDEGRMIRASLGGREPTLDGGRFGREYFNVALALLILGFIIFGCPPYILLLLALLTVCSRESLGLEGDSDKC